MGYESYTSKTIRIYHRLLRDARGRQIAWTITRIRFSYVAEPIVTWGFAYMHEGD
jgi:hypothetical protein